VRKVDQQYTAEIIFATLIKIISVHSKSNISEEQVELNQKILDLFPTKTYTDEQANRFGSVIFDMIIFCNKIFAKDIRIDFDPREEYQIFETVNDVYHYFFLRYTEEVL
jgi:hypothetical protein